MSVRYSKGRELKPYSFLQGQVSLTMMANVMWGSEFLTDDSSEVFDF